MLSSIFSSPLRKVPGPWHTHLTGLVGFYHSLTGGTLCWIVSLHNQHGPIVRTAPSEISVYTAQSLHKVHGAGSGFTKGPAFDRIVFGPVASLFTLREPKAHSERRKLLIPGFTLTSLQANRAERIHQQARLVVSQIKSRAEDGATDILELFRLFTADVIAEMVFGESFDLVATGKKTKHSTALKNASLNILLQRAVPGLSYLAWIPIRRVRDVATANKVIYDQGSVAVENTRNTASDRKSVFAEILEASGNKKGENLSDDVIRTEAAMFQAAGTDTTAITLTYAVWAVLKHPNVQSRLETELAALKPDFSPEYLATLTTLNNVINETLRLYSPAAGVTKRLVPPQGVTLEGYYLPKGTSVSTMPWQTFRDSNIFPDAERSVLEYSCCRCLELKKCVLVLTIHALKGSQKSKRMHLCHSRLAQ